MSTDIAKEVAEMLAARSGEVKRRVIESLAEEELSFRVKLVRTGLDKLRELKRALDKIRPDNVSYNGDGTLHNELWSKPKLEEKKKATESYGKLDAALAKALDDKPDYEPLKKLIGNAGKEEPQAE